LNALFPASDGEIAMKTRLLIAAAMAGLTSLAALAVQPARAQAPGGAAQPGQVVQVPTPPAGEQQKAEAELRKTIAAFATAKPNFDDMDTPLAEAVKQQSATLSSLLNAWGALDALEYKGWDPQHGVWAFQAAFQKGKAQCLIGFDKDGKMQTLWFKPVAA
jgi:hypothetical protein